MNPPIDPVTTPTGEPLLPSYVDRHKTGLYDAVANSLYELPDHILLADATYKEDFVRETSGNPNAVTFVQPGSDAVYEGVIVGEVRPRACGTKITACGNHYPGSASEKPIPIDDKSRIKWLIALGEPTEGSQAINDIWHDQHVTLQNVIEFDKAEADRQNKQWDFKEWTSSAGGVDKSPADYINLSTNQIYVLPKNIPKTIPTKKIKVEKHHASSSGEPTSSTIAITTATADVDRSPALPPQPVSTSSLPSINDLYDPHVLPDYGGPIFQHTHARVRQLDIRDVENKLIKPRDCYTQLRPGTFIMARCSLHAFTYGIRRVYQLNAHAIRVLIESPEQAEAPAEFHTRPKTSSLSTSNTAAIAMSRFALPKVA